MKLRLFDPEGLKPSNYKATYPELTRIKEFEDLIGSELMFVWYYANATSPLREKKLTNEKRAEEALKRSGYNPEPDEYERILKLQLSERMERAIDKMESFQPGARYFGWKALKSIFEEYQKIAQMKPSDFVKKSGSGDNMVVETDYAAYTNTTTKVVAALPGLIEKLEEGFGISASGVTEDEEEGHSILGQWHQKNLER